MSAQRPRREGDSIRTERTHAALHACINSPQHEDDNSAGQTAIDPKEKGDTMKVGFRKQTIATEPQQDNAIFGPFSNIADAQGPNDNKPIATASNNSIQQRRVRNSLPARHHPDTDEAGMEDGIGLSIREYIDNWGSPSP